MWKKSESPPLTELEQRTLLAILRLDADAYGLRIQAEIEAGARRPVSLSNVYATLARLDARGLVRSRLGDPSPRRGGRRKRLYAVQAAGKAALGQSSRTFQALAADLESLIKRS